LTRLPEHLLDAGPSVDYYDLRQQDGPGTPIEGDVAFYRRQAKRARGPILELGCGTGRVTFPLADAGLDVTGLDASRAMLRVARRKLRATPRPKVRLVRGDMRRFTLRRRFALVIIPFRAFQALLTVRDQRACLACIRRHLRPGGRLIIDLFDPRLEYCLPDAPAFPMTRPEGHDQTTGDEALNMRWTYRHEMRHLFELTGFRVVAEYGDFKGGGPRYGAEQVWVVSRSS
jgi:SAM-dependent methyltransferase